MALRIKDLYILPPLLPGYIFCNPWGIGAQVHQIIDDWCSNIYYFWMQSYKYVRYYA